MVFRSTPEKTEKTERLEVRAMGALWSIYKLILSHMTCLYMYPWECMYLRKWEDHKTVMGHNKHHNQKWNITRSPEFWIGDKSGNGEQ